MTAIRDQNVTEAQKTNSRTESREPGRINGTGAIGGAEVTKGIGRGANGGIADKSMGIRGGAEIGPCGDGE